MTAKIIIFDTETTGLPETIGFNKYYPVSEINRFNNSRLIQLAYSIYEVSSDDYKLIEEKMFYVKPDSWEVSPKSFEIHGKSTEFLNEQGISVTDILDIFEKDISDSLILIAHNYEFDKHVMASEAYRYHNKGLSKIIMEFPSVCTMKSSIDYCGIITAKGWKKFPKLSELYKKIFNVEPVDQHDALGDVKATAKCFFYLLENNIIM